MNGAPTPEYLNGLVAELRKLPTETQGRKHAKYIPFWA